MLFKLQSASQTCKLWLKHFHSYEKYEPDLATWPRCQVPAPACTWTNSSSTLSRFKFWTFSRLSLDIKLSGAANISACIPSSQEYRLTVLTTLRKMFLYRYGVTHGTRLLNKSHELVGITCCFPSTEWWTSLSLQVVIPPWYRPFLLCQAGRRGAMEHCLLSHSHTPVILPAGFSGAHITLASSSGCLSYW